jgi:PhnB protein
LFNRDHDAGIWTYPGLYIPILNLLALAIQPFLNFNGNCREAMLFYQSCFGGRLHFLLLGSSRYGQEMPEEMRSLVLQSSLISEDIRLYASDLVDEQPISGGSRISLMFSTTDAQKLQSVFKKLSVYSEALSPFPHDPGAGEWATLTDQFHIQWILSLDQYQEPATSINIKSRQSRAV